MIIRLILQFVLTVNLLSNRLTMENNYNNAETDPRLLEILLDLKSDVQKVIKRGKDCENGNGKMIAMTYYSRIHMIIMANHFL